MDNVAEVIESKACSSCGICVAACPQNAIEIKGEALSKVLNTCNECGICYEICPRVEIPHSEIEKGLAKKNQLKYHDDLLGQYTRIFLARSADESIRKVAYSGGMTTSFIKYLLEQKLIDAALLTDKVHNLTYCAHPRPRVATTTEDVFACSFTKPTLNPILSRLPVKGNRIAFVGTSCHIEAVRKAQFMAEHGRVSKKCCRELVGNISFLIGLNCFLANNLIGVEFLLSQLGLKEEEIKRFFYQKEVPSVELFDGTIKAIPSGNDSLEPLNLGCLLCYPSYTARLSDVTFGKTMSEEWGWNDVICRNKRVDGILTEMENKGLIESKETEDEGDEIFESLLEAEVFKLDAIGYSHYLATGKFSPDQTATSMMNRPGGTIRGETRLKLLQAVKKHSFYEPAVSAREEKNIHVPRLK